MQPMADQMVDLNLLAVEAILLTTMQKNPQIVQNGIIISVLILIAQTSKEIERYLDFSFRGLHDCLVVVVL